jgi:hypothetical protein
MSAEKADELNARLQQQQQQQPLSGSNHHTSMTMQSPMHSRGCVSTTSNTWLMTSEHGSPPATPMATSPLHIPFRHYVAPDSRLIDSKAHLTMTFDNPFADSNEESDDSEESDDDVMDFDEVSEVSSISADSHRRIMQMIQYDSQQYFIEQVHTPPPTLIRVVESPRRPSPKDSIFRKTAVPSLIELKTSSTMSVSPVRELSAREANLARMQGIDSLMLPSLSPVLQMTKGPVQRKKLGDLHVNTSLSSPRLGRQLSAPAPPPPLSSPQFDMGTIISVDSSDDDETSTSGSSISEQGGSYYYQLLASHPVQKHVLNNEGLLNRMDSAGLPSSSEDTSCNSNIEAAFTLLAQQRAMEKMDDLVVGQFYRESKRTKVKHALKRVAWPLKMMATGSPRSLGPTLAKNDVGCLT